MKGKKRFVLGLVLAVLLIAGVSPALAQRGSEVGGVTIFDPYLDPKASGTRLNGTLSIYYQVYQSNSPCSVGGPLANMFITLRLNVGKALMTFEGSSLGICYYDPNQQIVAIQDFITNQVIPLIPTLFPGSPWKFRSVSNVVDGDITQICEPGYTSFFADIEIAVQ